MIKPNIVHEWIAELEREGKSLGVITQNIDGLHEDLWKSEYR